MTVFLVVLIMRQLYIFPGALVIGTTVTSTGAATVLAHMCDSCSLHEILNWITTPLELRSSGAPQALSLLCLELAQESGPVGRPRKSIYQHSN